MITVNNSIILKAIGILMVIFCHIVGVFGIRYATPLGGIGVSIFLFISGYGLMESYKKNELDNYFKKRFLKVLLPYGIIVFLDSLIKNSSFIDIIEQILLLKTPNFMWFIQYIVFLYFCFYIINKFLKNQVSKNIAWIVIGSFIFMCGNELWAEQAIIFFIGGIISNNKIYIDRINRKRKLLISLILISIGIIALGIKQLDVIRSSTDIVYNIIQLILKNSIAIGIIIITCNVNLHTIFVRGLKYIGNISYELYLVHAIVFFILKYSINLYGVIEFLFITIIGSLMLHKILKKIYLILEERDEKIKGNVHNRNKTRNNKISGSFKKV